MRPPRSGWTIVFFSLVAAVITAAALDIIKGTALALTLAALVLAYALYQHLAKR